MAGEVYLLWLLPLLQTLSSYGAELSSEACREMGFSSNLLCSSCDLLGQFSLGQLDLPCRQCCQEEAQLDLKGVFLVAAVQLLFCGIDYQSVNFCTPVTKQSFLWLYIPSAFVRSDKPKMFRGLQIKYVRGSDPVLKLLDDNGNIAEELSILKWNTDSVEEFLSEKLEQI
ncbi:15 kDa selenoprotein-like [Sinocyclocheilus grahami]|uniref:15 kDa selenoprotein-like n=1 Tax=Sinocyclocheilus grahami TaxID=75366 RepID=UPI0007ACB7AB|nr:PREDICTED: 15 kDa selenoprotein-like [Sinocyclocheilus grahami]